MRYFPVGPELVGAAPLSKITYNTKCTINSKQPPSFTTPVVDWYSVADLLINLSPHPHHYIEIKLEVTRGCIAVAMQRQDGTIVEQLPASDRRGNTTVQFFVNSSEDCHNLLFRTWENCTEAAEFSIEQIVVRQAYREITEEQYEAFGPEDWVLIDRAWYTYLEFHILDYCNLDCPFCSHGTSADTRGTSLTTFEQLKGYRHLIEAEEFDGLKIAGGEPTIHPEFKEICSHLREFYKTYRYDLATNGARLEQFLSESEVFDWIDLSHYPGRNDEIFSRVTKTKRNNIFAFKKQDGVELFDSSGEPHSNKVFVFENCPCSTTKMVANGRIYDCPGVYGQMIPPKNLSGEKSSVVFDEDWRCKLAKVDIEEMCRRCFWPVDAPRVIGKEENYKQKWTLPKRIGQSIYSRDGQILNTTKVTDFNWSPPIEQPYEMQFSVTDE